MRLLDVRTEPPKLKSFRPDQIPPYLILSHTWRVNNNEEVLFDDIVKPGSFYLQKKAWKGKVRGFCKKALKHGYNFVWIDTCCIDKSSSAELSESINSMYRWYESAGACYVHLADVLKNELTPMFEQPKLTNGKVPVWFTRGWTLQELLAPSKVIFYDRDWQRLGSRKELAKEIHRFTRIPTTALCGKDPREFSHDDRWSWSEGRETTKTEDKVYSMLGLFNIFIGANYGEGQTNALMRAKRAIAEIQKYEVDDTHSRHAVSEYAKELQNKKRKSPNPKRSAGRESFDVSSDWVQPSRPSKAFVSLDKPSNFFRDMIITLIFLTICVMMASVGKYLYEFFSLSELWKNKL